VRHHTTSIAHAACDPAAVQREGGDGLLPMINATLPPGSRLHLRSRDSLPGGAVRAVHDAARTLEWEEDADGAHHIELDWDGEQGQSVLVVELPEAMTAAQRTAWMVLATRTIELHLAATRASSRVKELEKSEQLQQALYEIADLAGSSLELVDMLQRIHAVVARLMYAENFYIVLYDDAAQTYRFLYFADQMDSFRPDPSVEIPVDSAPNSLTMALIRLGEAVFGSSEHVRRRLGVSEDPNHGPDSADWLGVTMRRDDRVCGAIVVQSYDRPDCYGVEEQALLGFVAQHILTALDRYQAREELERRVEERTKALQLSNRDLHSEIIERQRAEKLQRALYRIAELSISAGTLEIFYAQVHAVVNELLDARNFYIALLSEDGARLEFPYSIDEHDAHRASRVLDSGMTEHVIETGRALLTDPHRMAGFRGHGTVAQCWLGVPLYRDNTVVGVIAVQSYSEDVTFTARDQDLLNFVANHISIGLTRKQEQERLVLAHAELEQRVDSRTRELAMANAELLEQIGERMRAEQQLTHQARHDELTGLPNRSQLLDHMGVAVTKAQANAHAVSPSEDSCGFAVLFLDLDRFKLINDSVGHSAGDDLLVEAGRRIVAAVRDHDLVARLGGDEFAVLVNDIEGLHVAKSLAQRVLHSLGQAYWIAGREVFPSASVGIAMWQPRYGSGTDLLRDADAAMYRAKASGRDRWAVFDEDMREEASRILDLEADLRRAINGDNFIPYYQPIMSLDGHQVVGHEALLRWRHPTRGLLAPGEFIGLGEDNGLIEEVDWLMYAQVITRLSRGVDGYVSVNVSPRHFRSADFADRLMRLIHNAGANPNQLRIEITEVALFDDIGRTLSTLHTLRSHGVLAQLDDFGTGYSALSCLHRFPIECLKIDRSFVAGLTGEKQAESIAVVRAIQALAGTLGIHTIGEGIETEAQRDILFELGCERGQGYLLGRPAPQMGQLETVESA